MYKVHQAFEETKKELEEINYDEIIADMSLSDNEEYDVCERGCTDFDCCLQNERRNRVIEDYLYVHKQDKLPIMKLP